MATAGMHEASAKQAATWSDGAQHKIAWRVSLPLFGGRYYIALFVGNEQRSTARLAHEGQHKSWWHTLCGAAIVTGLTAIMLMGTAATAYVAKSLLGIDLLEHHFVLHGMFFP